MLDALEALRKNGVEQVPGMPKLRIPMNRKTSWAIGHLLGDDLYKPVVPPESVTVIDRQGNESAFRKTTKTEEDKFYIISGEKNMARLEDAAKKVGLEGAPLVSSFTDYAKTDYAKKVVNDRMAKYDSPAKSK
ncbi:MAG: hypothetical protein ABL867_07840 [Rickettsiales bacterium]